MTKIYKDNNQTDWLPSGWDVVLQVHVQNGIKISVQCRGHHVLLSPTSSQNTQNPFDSPLGLVNNIIQPLTPAVPSLTCHSLHYRVLEQGW